MLLHWKWKCQCGCDNYSFDSIEHIFEMGGNFDDKFPNFNVANSRELRRELRDNSSVGLAV